MEITYKGARLKKICTNASEAQKTYGLKMAEKIFLRINQIRSAPSLECLVQYRIGDCHPLKGNRQGEYAMALVQPYRLIFDQQEDSIIQVRVISIEDYH